jgi:hypothetical protein
VWLEDTTEVHKCIRRDDGFTLTRVGMGREYFEIFQAKGSFGQFEFTASRWDADGDELFDYYLVFPSNKNKAFITKYALDIESALMHFPQHRFCSESELKKIKFLIPNIPPILASVEEYQKAE